MSSPGAFVVEAELELGEGCDPARVGAAVTTRLCGATDHEGPSRWPHNNAIDANRGPALLRIVVVAAAAEEREVREAIEATLRGAAAWRLVSIGGRAAGEREQALAARLADQGRAQAPGSSRPVGVAAAL